MAEKKVAHNLTATQLQELQEAQNGNGGEITMVDASNSTEYKVPEHEQHLFHVRLKLPQYNQRTGEFEGEDFVQKFTQREFDDMEVGDAFSGYQVTILHDPKGGTPNKGIDNGVLKQVQSAPAAGTPVIPENLAALPKTELNKIHEQLYPGQRAPRSTEDTVAAIRERVNYLKEENKPLQEDAKFTEENQKAAIEQGNVQLP